MTRSERRDKFEETNQVAIALIAAQRAARNAKTARSVQSGWQRRPMTVRLVQLMPLVLPKGIPKL